LVQRRKNSKLSVPGKYAKRIAEARFHLEEMTERERKINRRAILIFAERDRDRSELARQSTRFLT
jgi:hypothetical protein